MTPWISSRGSYPIASHQLRTPLAIIKAEVELAQWGTTKDDDLRATMSSIGEERSAEHAYRAALGVAAADEHRLSVNFEPVKIGDLHDVADRGRGRAQLQGRMITVEFDGAMISADRQRLEYAVGNIGHALTHGAGDLKLMSTGDGDVVELHVRDHGSGSPTAT
ncbi:MAG: sensor histidine kinase [Propionibacteriaceae bacterium]